MEMSRLANKVPPTAVTVVYKLAQQLFLSFLVAEIGERPTDQLKHQKLKLSVIKKFKALSCLEFA